MLRIHILVFCALPHCSAAEPGHSRKQILFKIDMFITISNKVLVRFGRSMNIIRERMK